VTNAATLLRTPGTIRYWQPGPETSPDPGDGWVEVDVMCAVQMRGRQEISESGQLSVTNWLAFLPPGIAPPKSPDELIVGGITYQFRGDAWLAGGTRGGSDHIEATLERAE
jgi:hypothetical protein